MKLWFYYLVKVSGWIGLRLFFGSIKILGGEKVPKDGAIILAPNHQGAFMDAVVVGTFCRKEVAFLTRSDVFNKWSTPVLKSLNMMPIYRIRDGYSSLSQNDQVFQTCFNILSKEKGILIFPEGNHSAEYYLRPLSKGSSRLALDARAQVDPSTKIYIVPTGINYFSHRRPFAKVFLKFGDPIDLDDYMELYKVHNQKGYNELKKDLSESMKDTLILPEKTEDYEERKKWIYQPKHENKSFDELREMALKGTPAPRKESKPGVIRRILIAFFSILNIVPLIGLKKILAKVKDMAFYVSIKYIGGGILHMLWWIVLYAIGAIWIGWEAGLLFAGTAILMMFARQSLIKF